MPASNSTTSLVSHEHGRNAARAVWSNGLKAEVADPLTAEFASAAVEEFSRLQSEGTPGIYRDALEGAEMSAEQLSVEPFQGIVEVIQNADDARATELRLAVRRARGGRDLLFVHDGAVARFPDIVAMALAFVSTKRGDAESKGRFGIGLKTLNALGGRLTIHSGPYDAQIDGNRLTPAPPAKRIEGLYSPDAGHTLFELQLRPGFEPADLTAWLQAFDPSSLLFLDTVRAVRLLSIRSGKTLVESRLRRGPARTVPLQVARQRLTCKHTTLRDPASARSWQRYSIDRPVPGAAPKRRHKATGPTTPIAVAIPDQPGESGRLYTGLPLDVELGVPFSVNAQFNVDTPRTGAQPDEWNGWLIDRALELTSAVSHMRFAEEPASGWSAVPLSAEVTGVRAPWLRERIAEGTVAIQQRLVRSVRVDVDGTSRRLNDFAFEARILERIVDHADLATLYPQLVPLPKRMRDAAGRWRAVLDELAVATEVDVADAMRLLDLDDEHLGERPVSWFIRFARAAIGADEGERLAWRRSIILADGSRTVPPAPHVEAEVLVRTARTGSLAARLGLARIVNPAYLTRNPEATVVRRWLEQSGLLLPDLGEEPALRALSRRGGTGSHDPVELDDADLIALRDALATLDRTTQAELGKDIGKAIQVRGYRWERGKRTRVAVRPADAYLPGTLEDRPDGFAKAAGSTRGLEWIETGYGTVLKRTDRNQRIPAALAFFRMLGAEIAPRLVEPSRFDTRYGDPATPIEFQRLTASQTEALSGRHVTHLKGEHLSPDLAQVVADIHRERSRKRRRERAKALLATFEREWQRLYEGHETARAVYSSNSWVGATKIPATWLAGAMDTAWLSTETGTPAAPRDLVVRTKSTEALYGRDADAFAWEVTDREASSPAVRALGLKTDPRVSEILDQLAEMQTSGEPVVESDALVRYAALSAAVTNVDPSPDSMIGDLTVRQLRGRFGADKRRPGLVLVDGAWLPPKNLLRGRPIFGARRAFVPDRSHSDRLWRVLGVSAPTISDCVEVLVDIARGSPNADDEQVLLNTYVSLAERLSDATRGERRAIAELPLWSGSQWLTRRPIYAVDDAAIAENLADTFPVWRPPLSARSLGPLVDALEVTRLDPSMFSPLVGDAEVVAGEPLREPYAAAVAHLRDWLARHDQTLSEALDVPWDHLADATIALAPQLQLELRVPHRRAIAVPAQAHVQVAPLMFCFSSEDDLALEDAGGRVVAELFSAGDRDKLALAWTACWAKAQRGERSAGMRLAEEDHEDDGGLDALFAQAAASRRQPERGTAARKQPRTKPASANHSPVVAVRRLKQADDLAIASMQQRAGETASRRDGQRRGLRPEKPTGRSIDRNSKPAPRSAPIAYSPQQQEHLALLLLQEAINGDVADLRDFRHLQGVGADALDRLDRMFEIKSFATVMPDQVTLTANEFERALKDGKKYYLAVVAGLEEGHQTVVRIVADPVRALTVQRSTSVILGGINSADRSIEVRFGGGEGDAETPGAQDDSAP